MSKARLRVVLNVAVLLLCDDGGVCPQVVGMITRKELLPEHIAQFDRFSHNMVCPASSGSGSGSSSSGSGSDEEDDVEELLAMDGSGTPLTGDITGGSHGGRGDRHKQRNITLDSLNC